MNLKFTCSVNVVSLTKVYMNSGKDIKTIFLDISGDFCYLRC